MTANHERRSRLVGFTIKQHSWDLEALKDRNRTALDQLAQANKKLHEIEALIEQSEKTIRRAMDGESSLDLVAIQSARQFLADQQGLRKGNLMEQQRATQRARQAETRLKEAKLYIKALKQVKAKSDRASKQAQEKRADEQNAELWMQRYGRAEWKTFR